MATETEKMEYEAESYVPGPDAVDVSPDKDGGVYKIIVTAGEGDETPQYGDHVFVHYTGKLLNGTQFDSSEERGEPFEFTLGKGEVIKGWDIGVATMKKGEKCTLVCYPDYAYGKQGSKPKIPENATLMFDVELIKWQLEDLTSEKDGGILRSIIQDGEGFVTPNEGAVVEVHLRGTCAGNVFEERDVKFEVGDPCEAGVVEGVDVAIQKFKEGEKSKIFLTPKYAFGAEGNAALNVPPNSAVEYEVTLNSFEKGNKEWNMTSEDKLKQAEIVKDKGTKYFKDGKYEVAVKQYKKVLTYLQYDSEIQGEGTEKKNSLLLAGYLNLAACYLKLEDYPEVLQNCEKALEIDPKSSKGLFRNGQAHLALKDFDVAKNYFSKVLEVDETNKAAQKNIYVCNENLKKQLQKEKQLYQAMFKKMAEQNEDSGDNCATQENGHVEKIETDDEKQAAAEGVKV